MGLAWTPSEQQWAAISAPLAPGVVVAGAGSGKTALMAMRVVYLVLTGQVRPDQVLGLTFTTKAAAELSARVRGALSAAGVLDDRTAGPDPGGVDVLEPTVATYHAYAASLLTEHGLRIGHEPDTRVVTDAARYQLGARVVDRWAGEVRHLTDHPETAIQNLLALDSAMSEHLVTPDRVRAWDAEARRGFERALAAEAGGKGRKTHAEAIGKAVFAIDRRTELLDLVEAYRRLKRELGLMDFSDQIELGARLATEQPDVGAHERAAYAVVLLDEYQDTSVAQATMLSRLFSGADAASGRGHPVTAVGDPNQAIYGWRGASASNLLTFSETFPPAEPVDGRPSSGKAAATPTVHHLTVSRRSDRRILQVANRLAAPLLVADDRVRPLAPAPTADEGEVTTLVFETHREELGWLAQEVREAHRRCAWSQIGVLTRDNAHAEEVFDALSTAGVPVEIVGLAGLLRLPEVAEVVAVLRLLHDPAANAALLTLLIGPRWAIGPRDLRLLGRRAHELAGRRGHDEGQGPVTEDQLREQLQQITDAVDPAEVPCLDDALADPGDAPYSPQARERFALLAAELRMLRAHAGEPLLDVVRRIIDTTGVDVELASAVGPAAAARRDNLDLLVKAVADFQAVDGDVTLPALLAYLTAEDDQGNGLDLATPSEADSVKLLTVHRAKGLEWDTVFLVGVCDTRFPSNRSRMLWTSSPAVLPAPLRGDAADLPQLTGFDKAALDRYRSDTRTHDAGEELRLGYVAVTRAAHRLSVTSYLWSPRATGFGPSPFQEVVRDQLRDWGEPVDGWLDKPPPGTANPYAEEDPARPWPVLEPGSEALLRREAARLVADADPDAPDDDLDVLEAAQVAAWDRDADRLLAEARRERRSRPTVGLPSSLSATALLRLREDPEEFAGQLLRPMPRPPSRAARLGTRFHAWVEARFGQLALLEADELDGRADAGLDDEELRELVAAFERGPFADRVPTTVEAPFALVLGERVIRGRIDAIYAEPDGGHLLVDWKTSRAQHADPLQLAVYREAWADLAGVPVERVRAGFCYVRDGELVEPPELPGREEIAALLTTRHVADPALFDAARRRPGAL